VTDTPTKQLDVEAARALTGSTQIAVLDRETGTLIERVTLLRYAGHYRSGAIHAFAIKDIEGKFRVRSAKALGLTEDSDKTAALLDEIDITAS